MAPKNPTEKPKTQRSRTTPAQMQTMVDYMASHSEFAAGRFLGQQGKINSARQWEGLANMLNGLGNVKSVAQWQKVQLNGILQNVSVAVDEGEVPDTSSIIESRNGKVYHVIRQDAKIGPSSEVWIDLKSRTRSKSQDLAKAMRQTGNTQIDSDKNLTPMDGKVLAVMGGQSSLGHSTIMESIEETQVVFDGNNLIVFEDTQPSETGDVVIGEVDDDLNFVPVNEEIDEVEDPDTAPRSTFLASSLDVLAETSAAMASTSAVASAASAVASTSSAASSESSNPASAAPRSCLSSRPPPSRARAHFSRAREQRQRREDFAMETRDRLADIQERQVQTQEMLARALFKIAENDAARLEQEKVNAAAMLVMAEAMKGLTRALENTQRKD